MMVEKVQQNDEWHYVQQNDGGKDSAKWEWKIRFNKMMGKLYSTKWLWKTIQQNHGGNYVQQNDGGNGSTKWCRKRLNKMVVKKLGSTRWWRKTRFNSMMVEN